jgi:hypothetical protein
MIDLWYNTDQHEYKYSLPLCNKIRIITRCLGLFEDNPGRRMDILFH